MEKNKEKQTQYKSHFLCILKSLHNLNNLVLTILIKYVLSPFIAIETFKDSLYNLLIQYYMTWNWLHRIAAHTDFQVHYCPHDDGLTLL